MMQFPLNDGGIFAVIEPGNLRRLKEGRPLIVGKIMIAFTPDMKELIALLGVDGDLPQKGEKPVEHHVHLTPERIQWALDTCAKLPEVER
jgi:hypothetical protein